MNNEEITLSSFWRSILILIKNFHAVNKKIFACQIKAVYKIQEGLSDTDIEHIKCNDLELKISTELLNTSATEEFLTCTIENFLQSKIDFDGFIVFYDMLAKKLKSNLKAIGIIDFNKQMYCCKFVDVVIYNDFSVHFSENKIHIGTLTNGLNIEKSLRWCDFVLKPKLINWSKNAEQTKGKESMQSLSLVALEQYNALYKELKEKYSKTALQFWTDSKECTNPLKFIYEDLSIASYLICLWRSTMSSTIVFADLGCGNGLLVYILTEEGFKGYGFDIRARKLWSHYPKSICLFEQAIEPETFKLPKEVNWLIGNHSDELSPWLPVVAAVASHDMCYFLLPCCAYEFSGLKFQRRNSSLSGYADFLEYMMHVSNTCGYKTKKDRLKIPSTKRIALIGVERTNSKAVFSIQKDKIWNFVRSERALHGMSDCIKLREKFEVVRNCTQIDTAIIDKLVLKIFMLLLQDEKSMGSKEMSTEIWQTGTQLSMRNIVNRLSKEDLSDIKNECGGIKTLLRNKHEIFEFCGNDLISIRKPKLQITKTNMPLTVKKRLCFFQTHHPNGCPLTDENCTFIHK